MRILPGVIAGLLIGPLSASTAPQKGVAHLADYTGDFGQRVKACIADLGPMGGICDATSFAGEQTLNSDLVIDRSDANLLLGNVLLKMGSHHIYVPPGVENVQITGSVAFGDSPVHGTGGSYLSYSGSGPAIQVGGPDKDTAGFRLENVLVDISGAAIDAVGINVIRTQQLNLTRVEVKGWLSKPNGQVLIRLDGTGNYTGGVILQPFLMGGNCAILGVGPPGSGANALTVLQSHIAGNYAKSSGNSVAIDLETADGDTIIGTDAEGWDVAYRLGPNAVDNTLVGIRMEHSGTTDIALVAGSRANVVFAAENSGRVVDQGLANSVMINYLTRFDNGGLVLKGMPNHVGNGQVGFGSQTSPSASEGSGAALPARPAGYLIINVSGKDYKVPYYGP